MIHLQTRQTRDGNWGPATVVCFCGEAITRDTSWEAVAAFNAHKLGRREPVAETPREGHGDGSGAGPLGAVYQAVRTARAIG